MHACTHTHTLKWKVRKVTSLAGKYRVLSAPRRASRLASPPPGCWGWTCRTACRSGWGAHSRCHTTHLCWKSQLSGKAPTNTAKIKMSAVRRWWCTESWHGFHLSSVFNHGHPVLLVATYTYFGHWSCCLRAIVKRFEPNLVSKKSSVLLL